ncbi:hypothetical protein FGO68_gene13932 [Halteria grandinella]|uniref:Uncharacterized protein n=1 Tax=Halteria grandinella TaxID=5974 RepID=A0A8J8NFB4_HALGN|nr:hypothetical protein FGO68_gene13932 [Halteria grandinella]
MESRATPESNEDCKCGRGQKVKFYCDQENCEKHKDNLFFCDYCFNEIMKKREPHFILQIPYLLQDLTSTWDELIDKIQKLQEQLATHYFPQKDLIASLEQTALNQPFSGRLVHRDMERFQKFHEEFQQIIPVVRGYIGENNVAELQLLKGQCTSFGETYQREFEYLMEIGKPTFIFDNYKPCIEKCLIPFYPEESKNQLLSLKVKLGQQNIANAQNAGKSHFSNEELAEAVSNLNYKVSVQEAQINAYISLVGNLSRAASLTSMCIKSQERGGDEQLKIIAGQIAQLQEESRKQSLLQQQVQDLQNSLEFQPQSLQYIQEGIVNSLKQSLSQEFQEHIDTQIKTLKDSTDKELKQGFEKYSLMKENLEKKMKDLQDYFAKEVLASKEKALQFESQAKIGIPIKPQAKAFAEEQKIGIPVAQLQKQQALIQPVKIIKNNISQIAALETKPQNNQPQLFTQNGLDNFLKHVKHNGCESLVEAAILHGLSIVRLNQHLKPARQLSQLPFEGCSDLKAGGIYYGQCVDGVRDGYGLLYCTEEDDDQQLFECDWIKGTPIKGRWIKVVDNLWENYQGEFDEEYLCQGLGSWEDEDGHTYTGEWDCGFWHGFGKEIWSDGMICEGEYRDGKCNGQAKITWPNDESYEGEWKDDKKHGLGKYTEENGYYEVGQWENDKRVGIHECFLKSGKLLKFKTYENGIVMKTTRANKWPFH